MAPQPLMLAPDRRHLEVVLLFCENSCSAARRSNGSALG
jgi:hypothetical protein